MTTADVWIDKAHPITPGYREMARGVTVNRHPRIKDIISGIIVLAAGAVEPIPLGRIHAVIHAMKSHESILSGLHFTVTGSVCYSRDIDQAVCFLTGGRFLQVVDGSVSMGEHAADFRNYLSRYLTDSQIQAVHSASLRFHERVRRDVGKPCDPS